MTASRRATTYTLEELTSATGVTIRTVRYYIAEGLLPPPDGAGRGARYSEDHRNRLDVIASLKNRHLPLREIRTYLRELPPDEIAELAQRARGDHQVVVPDIRRDRIPHDASSPSRGSSVEHRAGDYEALDYIRSIQESTPPRYGHQPAQGHRDGQRWRRLEISPEAELMVTEETWHRRREQIESLLAWARRIIDTEP